MRIFVDTSAFLAILFKRESSHDRVVKQYGDYKQQRSQLLTSNFILDEFFTRCLYRADSNGARLATRLINDAVLHNELTVLEVDTQIFKKAQDIFIKFSEHKISFTDATTYVLVKDFSLNETFTLDSDFKKVGLSTSI